MIMAIGLTFSDIGRGQSLGGVRS